LYSNKEIERRSETIGAQLAMKRWSNLRGPMTPGRRGKQAEAENPAATQIFAKFLIDGKLPWRF
jgi:hypothetical protein